MRTVSRTRQSSRLGAPYVHDLPCSVADGGLHYKFDPGISEALPENEIWLSLATDDEGRAMDEVIVGHTPRAEAQSLVIHGDGGARVACIDLE